MMVVVNLLKGVSAVLRNHGGWLHLLPPFSFPSPTSIRCQIKPNKNSRVLGKWEIQPLSQSPLRISLHKCKCTSASVDSSSSIIRETPSSPAGAGDVVDDGVVLKDSANSLDIRVGVILKAWRHEEADSLYVEEVDIGEPQPRIICSGLVNYVPLDHLQDRKVVVLANLKPRNMRGVKSSGMLMAASDASHENVELLVPPDGSNPGERIWFGSAEEKENLPEAATPNQIQKKKIWELVQPHLKTDTSCVAALGGHVMRTSAGVVSCRSLRNANVS